MEPTGSSPFCAIGVMMNLMLPACTQNACCRSSRRTALFRGGRLLGLDFVELDPDALDPFRIRSRSRERFLQLLVVDDAALLQVDEEHLPRLKTPLLHDLLLRYREAAALRTHDYEVVFGNDVSARAAGR